MSFFSNTLNIIAYVKPFFNIFCSWWWWWWCSYHVNILLVVDCDCDFGSKSTMSPWVNILPAVIFMSCRPILSNSFIKCWFMNVVLNLSRLVSFYLSRLLISIPIIFYLLAPTIYLIPHLVVAAAAYLLVFITAITQCFASWTCILI